MGYERVKLGDVASVRGGKRLPLGKDFISTKTKHAYIRARDIGGGKMEIHDPVFLDEAIAAKLARYIVNKGDVCLTIVGANVGEMGVVPPHLDGANLTENAVKIVTNGKVDQAFLKYALLSNDAMGQMKVLAGGAAQPKLGIYKVETIEFPFPPLPIQRRIVGILSAYDELIENSQRRIKILEAMARALYREWFIHFRFPGHENHPRVPSPLGEIPQGWEVKTIADLCSSVSYGYTSSASHEEVGPKFLRITDIVPDLIDWADVPFCKIPEDKIEKHLLHPGDIVVARTGATTGYAKRLNKLHPSTVFASYLIRVRTQVGVSNRMLGILMESDDYKQFIKTNIGGAAQPHANAGVLTSMRVVAPPAMLAEKFDHIVEPLLDETELLSCKIQNLRRTRDLLLPRLLSGQINVEAA